MLRTTPAYSPGDVPGGGQLPEPSLIQVLGFHPSPFQISTSSLDNKWRRGDLGSLISPNFVGLLDLILTLKTISRLTSVAGNTWKKVIKIRGRSGDPGILNCP